VKEKELEVLCEQGWEAEAIAPAAILRVGDFSQEEKAAA